MSPEAWKIISTSFAYIAAAICLPLAASPKLPAYSITTSTSGLTASTPATKPASKRSITNPSCPPTKPTLLVLVVIAAATPAKNDASWSLNVNDATFGKSITESTIAKCFSGCCSAISFIAVSNLNPIPKIKSKLD